MSLALFSPHAGLQQSEAEAAVYGKTPRRLRLLPLITVIFARPAAAQRSTVFWGFVFFQPRPKIWTASHWGLLQKQHTASRRVLSLSPPPPSIRRLFAFFLCRSSLRLSLSLAPREMERDGSAVRQCLLFTFSSVETNHSFGSLFFVFYLLWSIQATQRRPPAASGEKLNTRPNICLFAASLGFGT